MHGSQEMRDVRVSCDEVVAFGVPRKSMDLIQYDTPWLDELVGLGIILVAVYTTRKVEPNAY